MARTRAERRNTAQLVADRRDAIDARDAKRQKSLERDPHRSRRNAAAILAATVAMNGAVEYAPEIADALGLADRPAAVGAPQPETFGPPEGDGGIVVYKAEANDGDPTTDEVSSVWGAVEAEARASNRNPDEMDLRSWVDAAVNDLHGGNASVQDGQAVPVYDIPDAPRGGGGEPAGTHGQGPAPLQSAPGT